MSPHQPLLQCSSAPFLAKFISIPIPTPSLERGVVVWGFPFNWEKTLWRRSRSKRRPFLGFFFLSMVGPSPMKTSNRSFLGPPSPTVLCPPPKSCGLMKKSFVFQPVKSPAGFLKPTFGGGGWGSWGFELWETFPFP